MYSKEDINKIIDKLIQLISPEFPLSSVYLFGSYAQGNADEYSDIDLAIVSDRFEGSRFFDKKKLHKYILQTSIDLEIHPFKTEDFTSENPFVREILRTGKRIL
ncbi:MAG: nucleotidyltransferase domain-containing protein [Ignavibacteriaceae bacterium]|nr:nucleotidyltransferase domain-containing protein [Ignavibacteriaceae bacterium]